MFYYVPIKRLSSSLFSSKFFFLNSTLILPIFQVSLQAINTKRVPFSLQKNDYINPLYARNLYQHVRFFHFFPWWPIFLSWNAKPPSKLAFLTCFMRFNWNNWNNFQPKFMAIQDLLLSEIIPSLYFNIVV